MGISSFVSKRRTFGLAGIILSIIFIISFNDFLVFIYAFLEIHVSNDHHLIPTTRYNLGALFVFFILVLIAFSSYNLLDRHKKLLVILNSLFQLDEASNFFTTENLCTKKQYVKYWLVIGPGIGIIYYSYFLLFGVSESEGLIESSNSSLLFFAIVILLMSLFKIKNLGLSNQIKKSVFMISILITFFIVVLLGEEISWGQQIYHWKSAEIFSQYNFQNETNLHNFFNPLFKFVYPAAGIGLFIGLFFIWFFPVKNENYLFKLFVPHKSSFFLVFLMACTSCLVRRETFEELVAVFLLLYSIRIYMCLSYPEKKYSISCI